MKRFLFLVALLLCGAAESGAQSNVAVTTIDMGSHTIMKVRSAKVGDDKIVVASDYNGVLVAARYDGTILWSAKTGEGSINHDIWCADITGDGTDEIFAANGNGFLYCFNAKGGLEWSFTTPTAPHTTPMYAVTVVKDKNQTPYVICGGFDNNCYYLSAEGKVLKTLQSKSYSQVRAWGAAGTRPDNFLHYANFLRPIPQKDGSDLLVMFATNNHMQSGGNIYVFSPMGEKPIAVFNDPKTAGPVTDVRVQDVDRDGVYEILYGGTSLGDARYATLAFDDKSCKSGKIYPGMLTGDYRGKIAYRVNQHFAYFGADGSYGYALMTSNQIVKLCSDGKNGTNKFDKIYPATCAYNDFFVEECGELILASTQDGGSCIYIIDTKNPFWMEGYASIKPAGKIESIIAKEYEIREKLQSFKRPEWQRSPVTVINYEGGNDSLQAVLKNSDALEFSGGSWHGSSLQDKSWREGIYKEGGKYLTGEDRRNKYILSEKQVVSRMKKGFDDSDNFCCWAGHGNDPLYFSLDALKKVADYGAKHGKSVCYVWPEMNNSDEEFQDVVDKHIMPIAEHLQKLGGKIAIRTKDIFFSGTIYIDEWKRYISGEFADVFIPEMEETTDKVQDISFAGRVGLWMSGVVDGWGIRCSRDEVSFDRSRQFACQQLANHFFRKTLYSMASGANYIHNTMMNERHMGLYLELVNSEALYIPKREELLSINPVHFSMVNPHHEFLHRGEDSKWNTNYDYSFEKENPSVFSHLNGSWMGATLTPWDYSTIASEVVDRRQNIIPAYPNGVVLITPVQNGFYADNDAPRGKLVDKLHPIYKDIMKEYITDGVNYLSSNGKRVYRADKYYKKVRNDIEKGKLQLPVNVKSIEGGNTAWVVAQMRPKTLRLTLVDGGYLNPQDSKVRVSFNRGVKPLKIYDVIDGKEFDCSNLADIVIDVPCGMFRFINIEIAETIQ